MKGCSIEPDPEVTEARMECGLVRGHAYSITKVLNAKIETPDVSGIIKQNFFCLFSLKKQNRDISISVTKIHMYLICRRNTISTDPKSLGK